MHKALCGHRQSAIKTRLNQVSQQVLSATCLVLQFLCLLLLFIIVVIADIPAGAACVILVATVQVTAGHAFKVHPSNKL